MPEEITVVGTPAPATPPTVGTPPAGQEKNGEEKTHEETVAYERFQQANKKAREAADRAKALESEMAQLRSQIEERESAGLPELERMKKDLERAAKRAEEAEQRATDAESKALNSQRERWVSAAAVALNFIDPDDAVRNVELGDIESADDAERAVKRVAKAKKHLVKADGPTLPGQVLKNGQPASVQDSMPPEVRVLSEGLRQFASK